MKVLDLFSGIGGFSLGLERAGFETAAFCEIEPYARRVLAKNWPGVPIYEDVRQLSAGGLASDGVAVDVITAGFPCQDLCTAGKKQGISAERSGLWSECARLLGSVRPRYAIFENVTALLAGDRGDWFKRVLWDISSVGYDAEWHCIPASQLGAHHHRDRVWIVAYPNSQRRRRWHSGGKDAAYAGKPSIFAGFDSRGMVAWDAEPDVGRVANGVPDRSHRNRCLGNAVVPQIPELIGMAIMQKEGMEVRYDLAAS